MKEAVTKILRVFWMGHVMNSYRIMLEKTGC